MTITVHDVLSGPGDARKACVVPRTRTVADLAVAALIAEAALTPKPGLVDRRGGGAHTDMDLALLRSSAESLRGWFAIFAHAARTHGAPDPTLRAELARLGRLAEADMLAVTGGVNTHRGAVWALGLLVAAVAIRPTAGAGEVADTAAAIARMPDDACPPEALLSHGARAGVRYGAPGARGEAVAGFPHVTQVALPVLHAARRRGEREDTARLEALLALMASVDDTCVLHRGGLAGLRTVQRGASAVLRLGGPGSVAGRARLAALDLTLIRLRLSPGGCADLLGATLFLDTVSRPLQEA